jgi:hypothetical protein
MHLENVPSKEPGREEETKLFQFEILKLRALYQTTRKKRGTFAGHQMMSAIAFLSRNLPYSFPSLFLLF